MKRGFSVLILTLNERQNIGRCVRNARQFSDDVVVLDSNSLDGTPEIARHAGARVVQHQFEDFASQRNWGIQNIQFENEWVFHLDADERLTATVTAECLECIARDDKSGYFLPARQMVWGRWLKHASCYPVYQMRFHKVGEADFVQIGHGQREGESARGYGVFESAYLHYPLSKGLSEWIARHNRYSTAEAAEVCNGQGEIPFTSLARDIFRGDDLQRWRAMKVVSSRVPFPVFMSFTYLYLVRGGFMDGHRGFRYCWLQSLYQDMIRLKAREIRESRRGRARA